MRSQSATPFLPKARCTTEPLRNGNEEHDFISPGHSYRWRRIRLVVSGRCRSDIPSRSSEINLAMDLMISRRALRFRKRCLSRRRRQTGHSRYLLRRYLLSQNEAAFFRVLANVLGTRYHISCKVRLADLIGCADKDWSSGGANRISQKHVDFVICDARSSRIIAAVELDDSSHQRPDRRKRDDFINWLFARVNVCLLRIPARNRYAADPLRRFLEERGIGL
jgi:hypothetical protein